MWIHLFRLLGKALAGMPSIISSNWTAVFLSAAIFLLSQTLLLSTKGWAAMKRQWAESVAIGIISIIGGWILLYGWSVVKTVYADHQSLIQNVQQLKQDKAGLVDPKTRDDQIKRLKGEVWQLRQAESGVVRVFPVAHYPRTPNMEYVLTTGTIRTPVDIIATCDFPIADVSMSPLTESGGSVFLSEKHPLSPMSYEMNMTSPAWSPASPLWVAVVFQGTVSRLPTCRFTTR